MSKRLSLNVSFGKEAHIFECYKNEVEQELLNYFNLKPGEVDFYEVSKGRLKTKTKIKPSDVKDFMQIQIRKKTEMDSPLRVQKFSSDYEIGESSKQKTIQENLVSKLKSNATLNGMERKYLMQMIEGGFGCNGDVRSNRKRKNLDETSKNTQVANKKVQVNAVSITDSCTQTDVVEDDVLRPPETQIVDVLQKMKVIAGDVVKDDVLHPPETQVVVLQKMKIIAGVVKCNPSEIEKLMSDTYDDRRNYIIAKMPPVKAVKEKYPLLFTVKEIKNELDRIFYIGKSKDFLDKIAAYAPIIVEYAPKDHVIYHRTLRRMEKAKTEKQKNYAQQTGALLLLPLILKEKLSFLKLADNRCSPGIFPHISSETTELREMFFDGCTFKIIVEDTLLCVADTFPEAILCMVAAFYIFQIEYCPDYFNTCVLFEKLFLTANETEEIDPNVQQYIKLFRLKLR